MLPASTALYSKFQEELAMWNQKKNWQCGIKFSKYGENYGTILKSGLKQTTVFCRTSTIDK